MTVVARAVEITPGAKESMLSESIKCIDPNINDVGTKEIKLSLLIKLARAP
jgi:hypothetical protein